MEHTIRKQVKCLTCNGDGMVDSPINIKTFVKHMNNYDQATQKLEAIKAIRFEYRVGLKVAKEMVECYFDFVRDLQRGK